MVQLFSPEMVQRLHQSRPIDERQRLLLRLAIGFAQGLSAYFLFEKTSFENLDSTLLVTWALVTAYAPPVLLAAVGQLSTRSTLIWGGFIVVLIAALGISSQWMPEQEANILVLLVCLPIALFCAHHLVVPAINQRSLFAPYENYFETAWKAGIQLVLALMFLGVFWIIMVLGALLFNAIGLKFVEELISQPLFVCLASGILFALGVELSDVRDTLTQGIRTVALTLLSWLLPIAVFIAGAFVIALPIAGVAKLHTSLSPAGLMLAASGGLIILINTVYQDGGAHLSPSSVLRIVMRVAIILLLPMTAFALWAVAVRIGQYGLTLSRVVAITAAIIGLLYALGYSVGQLVRPNSSRGWLPLFEATNVVVGGITALTLVAFSTPWLNPIQLSFNSQISRIEAGKLAASDIPYSWLGWQAGPKGRALLEDMTQSSDPVIAKNAKYALENRHAMRNVNGDATVNMYPEGTAVPEGLAEALPFFPQLYECTSATGCMARLYDIDADQSPEVLILNGYTPWVLKQTSEGKWIHIGHFEARTDCNPPAINQETFKTAPIGTGPSEAVNPVAIGSKVFDFKPFKDCNVTND